MQSLADHLLRATEEGYDLRSLELTGEEVIEAKTGSIDLKNCSFSHCSFSDCKFDRTGFQNVSFINCDLSGTSFLDCGFKQVIFRDCRLFGTVFDGCVINTGSFEGCAAKYLRLSGCTLRSVALKDSNFSGGSLARLKCVKTTVDKCDFSRCDFSGSDLYGFDFTRCVIDGAIWSLDGLKGITVTAAQALEFSKLLGLNIQL